MVNVLSALIIITMIRRAIVVLPFLVNGDVLGDDVIKTKLRKIYGTVCRYDSAFILCYTGMLTIRVEVGCRFSRNLARCAPLFE